jgi:hypothetical protein
VRALRTANPSDVPSPPVLIRVHRFGTESLRQGRFSPADAWAGRRAVLPSPPVSPSPAGRERGIVECGSSASALQIGQRAAPLAHAVGEGLGVRAKKRVCSPRSEPKCCTLISTPCVPLSRRAGEGERAAPLSHAVGEGLGVGAKKRVCSPRSEPKCCTLISTPCVPLSRRAGEGERAAPLSHAVGEGLGVRAVRRGILSNTSGGRYPRS